MLQKNRLELDFAINVSHTGRFPSFVSGLFVCTFPLFWGEYTWATLDFPFKRAKTPADVDMVTHTYTHTVGHPHCCSDFMQYVQEQSGIVYSILRTAGGHKLFFYWSVRHIILLLWALAYFLGFFASESYDMKFNDHFWNSVMMISNHNCVNCFLYPLIRTPSTCFWMKQHISFQLLSTVIFIFYFLSSLHCASFNVSFVFCFFKMCHQVACAMLNFKYSLYFKLLQAPRV